MKIRNVTNEDMLNLLYLVKNMRSELKDENYKVVDFHLSIIEKNLGLYLDERSVKDETAI